LFLISTGRSRKPRPEELDDRAIVETEVGGDMLLV
jgi:hypothetical protein